MLKDGWIYTGDVGMSDSEDFIFVVDRKKDMIISGGSNIYSREVEDACTVIRRFSRPPFSAFRTNNGAKRFMRRW